MEIIEAYIEALEKKDYKELASLFTKCGSYCDYCPNGTKQHEFHLYGREAIEMFFRNKFLVSKYAITEATILSRRQAEFIASYDGYHVMAIATLQQMTGDGHIMRLTVRTK